VFLLCLSLAAPALAQFGGRGRGHDQDARGRSGPPAQSMSHEERQRLREDVNSARGNYSRPEPQRRQDRMAPEERERLRRDVQDANREMRRR
jgi:hypothetical protein